jgi:molecular chaperone GrpE|tara:strand:- start:676 stop:1209 length:534 start_codon:yes stop_codon:yes gene_type:complete
MGNKEEKVKKEEVKNNTEGEKKEESKQEAKKVSMEDKLEQAEDKFLRIFSEYENFRKRTQKEKADLISGAAADVYKVLLPILDDLDRAKENIEKAEDIASLKQGLELIFDKLTKSLKSNGLELMDVKEQDFNADEHEAITNIPAPSEELKGKVIEVVEQGYTLKGKIIRFPKVVVGA